MLIIINNISLQFIHGMLYIAAQFEDTIFIHFYNQLHTTCNAYCEVIPKSFLD